MIQKETDEKMETRNDGTKPVKTNTERERERDVDWRENTAKGPECDEIA